MAWPSISIILGLLLIIWVLFRFIFKLIFLAVLFDVLSCLSSQRDEYCYSEERCHPRILSYLNKSIYVYPLFQFRSLNTFSKTNVNNFGEIMSSWQISLYIWILLVLSSSSIFIWIVACSYMFGIKAMYLESILVTSSVKKAHFSMESNALCIKARCMYRLYFVAFLITIRIVVYNLLHYISFWNLL